MASRWASWGSEAEPIWKKESYRAMLARARLPLRRAAMATRSRSLTVRARQYSLGRCRGDAWKRVMPVIRSWVSVTTCSTFIGTCPPQLTLIYATVVALQLGFWRDLKHF